MPSFDIVSEITLHEVRNAVENANRVLSTRYDFRGVEAVIELNEKNETIKITTESDFQLEQLIEILIGSCIKRGIEHSSLDIPQKANTTVNFIVKKSNLNRVLKQRWRRKLLN